MCIARLALHLATKRGGRRGAGAVVISYTQVSFKLGGGSAFVHVGYTHNELGRGGNFKWNTPLQSL